MLRIQIQIQVLAILPFRALHRIPVHVSLPSMGQLGPCAHKTKNAFKWHPRLFLAVYEIIVTAKNESFVVKDNMLQAVRHTCTMATG